MLNHKPNSTQILNWPFKTGEELKIVAQPVQISKERNQSYLSHDCGRLSPSFPAAAATPQSSPCAAVTCTTSTLTFTFSKPFSVVVSFPKTLLCFLFVVAPLYKVPILHRFDDPVDLLFFHLFSFLSFFLFFSFFLRFSCDRKLAVDKMTGMPLVLTDGTHGIRVGDLIGTKLIYWGPNVSNV